jgi:hypothetical protein
MNQFIKQVIEEKFASKSQQKLFFAKAKNSKKWKKWSKEFSDKTDYSKIPDKVEKKEVDEIIDDEGNFATDTFPTDLPTKGITSKSTTDDVVRSTMPQMGTFGVAGGGISPTGVIKYWTETDMSKALGAKETILQDVPFDQAKGHMEDELGLSDDEAEERLEKMGYDEKLPEDKLRLIENPKKFVNDYLESILVKKSTNSDVLEKDEEKEVNPIILKQIEVLKNTLKNNNLSVNDVLSHLKDNE